MKSKLLDELNNHTYVMLKPSPIAGIGVFAIQNIAMGCREMFGKPDIHENWIKLSKAEVELLPHHVKLLVENYCLYDAENYFAPDYGFKKVDLSLFLNHSENPNLISIQEGDYFEAIRDIANGEELFIDYGKIVDD